MDSCISPEELRSLGFSELASTGHFAQWSLELKDKTINCLYENRNKRLKVWDKTKTPQIQYNKLSPTKSWIEVMVINKYQ